MRGPEPAGRRGWLGPLGLGLAVVLVWAANRAIVASPIEAALGDPRLAGARIAAHFRYYVDPGTLVLDLRSADSISPFVLFRLLLESAHAVHESYRPYARVLLTHHGTTVFRMDGKEFDLVGELYGKGEDRSHLILTLPPRLHRPDGSPAFDPRTGDIAGVLAGERADAEQAARRWAQGSPP